MVFPTNAQAWRHEAARSLWSLGPVARRGSRRKIHIHCPAGEWHIRREGELTNKHWKYELPSSPPATSAMSSREAPPVRVNRRGMLPEPLDQIPPEQQIASVTADGAFDTLKCHKAIAARGAAAIIPPRKNAKP